MKYKRPLWVGLIILSCLYIAPRFSPTIWLFQKLGASWLPELRIVSGVCLFLYALCFLWAYRHHPSDKLARSQGSEKQIDWLSPLSKKEVITRRLWLAFYASSVFIAIVEGYLEAPGFAPFLGELMSGVIIALSFFIVVFRRFGTFLLTCHLYLMLFGLVVGFFKLLGALVTDGVGVISQLPASLLGIYVGLIVSITLSLQMRRINKKIWEQAVANHDEQYHSTLANFAAAQSIQELVTLYRGVTSHCSRHSRRLLSRAYHSRLAELK